MYAWYKSHVDVTLSYIDDTSRCFYTFKDVFLLGRAGKKVKVKGNALWTELMKKRKADEETYADTWTPSKKQREINTWQDYISHERHISKELDADFNVWRSTSCFIGSKKFVDTEPGNSILPRDMNKQIKRTLWTVGTPPITISMTFRK